MGDACSELSFCESQSALSSTLVTTPFSTQDSLVKRSLTHIESHGAGSHTGIKAATVCNLKPPQPPKLHASGFGLNRLSPNRLPGVSLAMYQSQVAGKGPIQPHVTNLPRRQVKAKAKANEKGRGRGIGVVVNRDMADTSPSARRPTLQSRVTLTKDNYTLERSPGPTPSTTLDTKANAISIHRSSSAESVRGRSSISAHSPSSHSPSLNRFNIANPSSPTLSLLFAQRPLFPSHTPTIEALSSNQNLIPKAKGHIQPHVNNIPRRTRNRKSLLNRLRDGGDEVLPEPEPGKVREEKSKEWMLRKCLEEVGRKEEEMRVWVSYAFDDDGAANGVDARIQRDSDTEDEEEEETNHKEFEREFEEGVRVCEGGIIRVSYQDNGHLGEDEAYKGPSWDGKEYVLRLYIPRDPTRDDGVPRLSKEQIRVAGEFIERVYSNSRSSKTPSTPSSTNPSLSVPSSPIPITPHSPSISALPPQRLPQKRKLLLMVPPGCESDALALIVLTFEITRRLEAQTALSSPPSASSPSLPSSTSTLPSPSPLTASSSSTSSLSLSTSSSSSSSSSSPRMHERSHSASPPSPEFPLPPLIGTSGGRTLTLLTRLYDLEELGMPWRGSLSCDGVEWLDEVLCDV